MDVAVEAGIDVSYFARIERGMANPTLEVLYAVIKSLHVSSQTLPKKHQAAEQELNKKMYTSEEFGTASEKVLNTLKNPTSMWKSDDYNDKRTILFMYFEDQLRFDYYRGFGTTSLAYPIKLINELGQAKTASVEMWSSELQSRKLFKKLLQA